MSDLQWTDGQGQPVSGHDGSATRRTEWLLSVRETQVLAMTSRGFTNLEIATRLAITVHTVKFHLASIYRKLGVENRTEAAFVYLHSALDQDDAPPVPTARRP